MAEYIEREALKSQIAENKLMAREPATKRILAMIDDMTAADVAPVVHGRWYMRGGRACCSNCNIKALWKSDWDGCKNHEREFVSAKSNYCPNCGAKMDEEEHNNV